ncbi:2-dehydropantoate 2-reductase [Thermococcus sp. 101 C5]|uniref:2-dehydropantoate 2-reductase n=1 Tax=Thermococcus sibiricus TaxID=172049 RepID=A0A117L123_9EURY|nr:MULTISPECIES: 2-dehydropantoate 2-reductase [Thermococcus]KUK16716.1 MAG: 2-dehydropantoate 2-reductase [Thermococcus sibiricus]MCA6214447.1 2-dehydropantoate 2-reductase [Thermococcus bergensis]MPW39338.1 2-dehydropantoate 2-reductase [Thermococcus sp. 101 C5]
MKIYILGAGSIGSLFGALLTRIGEDVTLIGRKEHVDAINNRGLRVVGAEEFTVYPRAVTEVPPEPPDLIILATKSYSTAHALKCARESIGKNTWILSIQNGLGNEEEALKYTKNVLGGITTNGAALEKWEVVRWTGKGVTIIGNYPKGRGEFAENVVALLKKAGLEAEISDNIIGWKWAKAIVNSAINPIGTIMEVKNGIILGNDYLLTLAMEVVKEGCQVATQLGIEFDTHPMELLLETLKRTRENYNSMLQDVRRGKTTEIDFINGKIIEYGEKMGLKTPLNFALWSLVKAKESQTK